MLKERPDSIFAVLSFAANTCPEMPLTLLLIYNMFSLNGNEHRLMPMNHDKIPEFGRNQEEETITVEEMRRIVGEDHIGSARVVELLIAEQHIQTKAQLLAALDGNMNQFGCLEIAPIDSKRAEDILKIGESPQPITVVILSKNGIDEVRARLGNAFATAA